MRKVKARCCGFFTVLYLNGNGKYRPSTVLAVLCVSSKSDAWKGRHPPEGGRIVNNYLMIKHTEVARHIPCYDIRRKPLYALTVLKVAVYGRLQAD